MFSRFKVIQLEERKTLVENYLIDMKNILERFDEKIDITGILEYCHFISLRLIDFLHNSPASESHHHNFPGGLLTHSMDVSKHAIELCIKDDLVNEFNPIDISSFLLTIIVAGLFHDAGKIKTDFFIFDQKTGNQWEPLEESLTNWTKANEIESYSLKYYEERIVNSHINQNSYIFKVISQGIDLTMLIDEINSILDYSSLRYLNIVKVIKQADSLSVSNYMKYDYFHEILKRKRSLTELLIIAISVLSKSQPYNYRFYKNESFISYPQGISSIIYYLQYNKIKAPLEPPSILEILNNYYLIENDDVGNIRFFKFDKKMYIKFSSAFLTLSIL